MKSISFPRMLNKNTTRIKTDHDAVVQNMKVLLDSEQGQFLDDPYFGVNLKRYLYDQNNVILRDILVDEIYTQLAVFMPQLKVDRRDIKIVQKGIDLYATIRATNLLDFTTNLYSLVLFQGDAQ